MIRWTIGANGNLRAFRLPFRAFQQSIMARLHSDVDVELYTAKFNVQCIGPNGASWPEMTLPSSTHQLGNSHTAYFNLVLPFDDALIRAVEDWRMGGATPVKFEITAELTYRPVSKVSIAQPQPQGQATQWVDPDEQRNRQAMVAMGSPSIEQYRFEVECNRDKWIGILNGMGWDEFQLFEVPIRVLKRQEVFVKGLELLRSAQTAFHQGQWDTAVTESRRAVEAAARAVKSDGDTKSAVTELLRMVFPLEHEEAKRKAVSGVMIALADLRNQTAHGHNLLIQIRREDAEFALTIALSIFRYMGEEFGRQDRKNEG